jgi:malate synthase
VDIELFRKILAEELQNVRKLVGEEAYNSGTYEKAAKLFDEITTTKDFVEFLTLPAYNML